MPSDRRDLFINTLLGLFLLTAASLIFVLFVGAAWLVLLALKYLADLVLPGVVLPKYMALPAIYVVWCVIAGLSHLRRRLWRNAFLCFAAVPAIAFAWLADPHSFLWLWIVFMVVFTPMDSLIPRNEFFTAALVAGAVVIVSTGLAGSGEFMGIVSMCTQFAAGALLVIQLRRNQTALKTKQPAAPMVA